MATFDFSVVVEPTYIDFIDIAAGYGVLSIPVDGFFQDDYVQTVTLEIFPTATPGSPIISRAIDMVQRTSGFFEFVTQDSISAHFSLSAADVAAIAAVSGGCSYSSSVYVLRNGITETREVQAGTIAARSPSVVPPMLATSIVITGGPVTGAPQTTAQLTATVYDGFGNVVPFVVTWVSTNPSIASVDANGLVTFVIPGVVTIAATVQYLTDTTTATTTSTVPITPTDGDVLFYVAADTAWEPLAPTADRIKPGTFSGSGSSVYGFPGPVELGGLTYTFPGSQTAGSFLKTDGLGNLSWALPIEDVSLGQLSDVTLTTPSTGQFLTKSAGDWVNHTLVSADVSDAASINTASVLVRRDASGNFAASVITAATGIQVTTGGITVSAGTSAFQAITATTGGFSGAVTVSSGGITVTGNSTMTGTLGGITTLTATTGTFTSIAGTLTTAAQPNVTSTGILAAVHMTSPVIDSGGLVVTAGSVTASSFVGALTGNADTATRWQTGHTIWGQSVDGTADVSAALTVATGGITVTAGGISVVAGTTAVQALTATTGNFSSTATASSFIGALSKTLTFGTHLTGTSFNNSADVTLATDATAANTVSTIIARDGSGNFAAGTFTSATGITITTGGMTIAAGTLAAQAITGTTGVFSSTLASAGFSATTGAFSSTLSVTGDFAVATTKFTVAASSGNTVVAGTLSVTGDFAVNTTMFTVAASSGNTVIAGTLNVTGQITGNVTGTLTGNADSATAWQTSRTIWGQAVNGTANVSGALTVATGGITVTAGGLTVSSGTSAFQAVTSTSLTASGVVTANAGATVASGQTLTLTGATVAGTPTWSSSQAITLSTAAQPNVTSVGTLTSITTSGALTFTAAASKIVPGATSMSIRNNADSADNLFVNDVGAVTTRSTLTVSSGGIVVTAGGISVAAGGLTVTLGGLTVSAGTTAVQALTATTGVFTSTVSMTALTATTGTFSGAINSQTISATASFTGTVAIAGTATVGAATDPIQIGRVSDSTTRGLVTWNSVLTLAGNLGISGSVALGTLVYNAATGGGHSLRVNNVEVVGVSGSGLTSALNLTVTTGGITVSAGTTAVQALTATTGTFSGALSVSTTSLLTGRVSVGSAAQTNGRLNVTYDGNVDNGVTFFDTDATAVHSNTFINFERNAVAVGDVRYIGSTAKLSFNSAGSLVLGTNGTTAALTIDTSQDAVFASAFTTSLSTAHFGGGKLRVGNSASATVAVGTLANKYEVFNAAGASLGFVPIYATIT